MNRFELVQARSLPEARSLCGEKPGAVFKAGGIDLLDHLKERLVEPPRIVDIRSIPALRGIKPAPDGSLALGALSTLAEIAASAEVGKSHRALAQACGEAASPQIRNVATVGGNVLQRPRCWYYRLESYPCLKKGGDVCYAATGENRYHAIFGGDPEFIVHPSNAAVPLVAFGATFVLDGPKGIRSVPAAEFFVLPKVDPKKENVLAEGELLVEIRVPALPGMRSAYADVRERAGFDWPLVSMAAGLRIEGGIIRDARVVLGAVAPIPWRSVKAEGALMGQKADGATFAAAAEAAVAGAEPLEHNRYKIDLVRTLVRRTLASLA
jgi:xanthine dehydrogenase YagS FAD-binding subunit